MPVRLHEELNFDILSRRSSASVSQLEDGEGGGKEDEDSPFETLVRGDRAESVILSPRASQQYSVAPSPVVSPLVTPVVSPRPDRQAIKPSVAQPDESTGKPQSRFCPLYLSRSPDR